MPAAASPEPESAAGTVTCPNCGAANPAGNRFCGSCGRALTAAPAVETPPAAAKPAEPAVTDAMPVAASALAAKAEPAPPARPAVPAVPAPPPPLLAAAAEVGDVAVPDDPIAQERERDRLLSLANVQRMRAQVVDARKTLQQALIVSQGLHGSQVAPIHEMIGDLMASEERWEQAADSYEQAHLLDPTRRSAEKKYGEMTLRLADEKALAKLGAGFLEGEGSGLTSGVQGRRNPGFAMLLALVVPGFGQFYNGQFVKGAICLGLFVLAICLIALSGGVGVIPCLVVQSKACRGVTVPPITWLCLAIVVFTWLYGVIDAPMTAARTSDVDTGGPAGPVVDKSGWEV